MPHTQIDRRDGGAARSAESIEIAKEDVYGRLACDVMEWHEPSDCRLLLWNPANRHLDRVT